MEEKQEVQAEIDAVEAQIKQKEGEIKPAVEYILRGPFSKSEDADAFIDQVEIQARRAKAAAESKK